MLHLRSIFYLIGWLILILAGGMIPCAFLDYVNGCDDYKIYLMTTAMMAFLGTMLIFSNKSHTDIEFDKKDSFLLTSIAWIVGIIFSTIPFFLCSINLSWTDAFFETVSGLTTTGATILKNLDHMPQGILLWRSILQWLGGVGIVVMALTILTDMRIGGMELFQSESSDRSEKFLPRVAQMMKAILTIYILLTILCFVGLNLAGMSWFDSLCHAFSTVSSGGFSTHDASVGYFKSPWIHYIIVLFMITSGMTQALFSCLWTKQTRVFFKDEQLRTYVILVVWVMGAVTAWNIWKNFSDPLQTLDASIFNAVSVVTTTGFMTASYDQWGTFPLVLFFLIPFVGGSTGSTSGGMKVFRFQILWKITVMHLQKLRRPHGIFMAKFNGKKLSDSLFESVAAFVILFIFCFVVLSLVLSLMGLDFLTALSAATAVLTNLGPGLGHLIGPAETYAPLSDTIKWILMMGMLLGRLEVLTLLVLFLPSFWRH